MNPKRRPVLTVLLTLLTTAFILPVFPASAAVTFVRTLAGPSVANMYPSGLEYDDANNRIVVADTGLDKIQFYTLDGVKLGEFGSHGAGDGQFDSPRDAAIGANGWIYVADAGNNRLQAFDSNGIFQWKSAQTGSCPTCLNTPIGVTYDAVNNAVLVASTGQDLIKAFNPTTGAALWQSPGATGPDGNTVLGFNAPRDVIRGPDGRIWVSDYDHHLIKVYDVTATGTWTTTPVTTIGLDTPGDVDTVPGGHGLGEFNFPYNVDFSPDGLTAYISSTGDNRVSVWNVTTPTSPVFVEDFGGNCPESPDTCADPPADLGFIDTLRRVVVTNAGTVITADFWGNGMQTWTAGGDPIREIELVTPPVPGFAQAFGVATAPNGGVYVIDRLNQRIERFDATGAFLGSAGNRGTAAGRFSWPEAVAVAADGTVWIGDTRNDRIQKWPASLSPLPPQANMFGTTGIHTPANPLPAGRFNYIEDIEVGPNGLVYIADTRNDRIQNFNPATSTFGTPFGIAGSGSGNNNQNLQNPQGVAVSATHIFVADTDNNRIRKFDLNGAFVATYGTIGSGPTQLDHPNGIALAADGTVWVADTNNNRIVHLSADLVNLNDGFGSVGSGDMQFNLPHTLALSGSTLYVADTFNNRVQVFNTGTGGGPDTSAPTAEITVPAASQVFPPGQITFSGTAVDNVGVTIVRVAIKDTTKPAGANWWRVGGTWGAFQNQTTTLGTPGGTSTTWSYNWTPPASGSGSYSVQAEAVDAATNVTPAPKPVRQFTVSAGSPDTTPPTPVITAPTAAQSFPNGVVGFGGTATDNVGVTVVRVAIKDLARPAGQNWWRVGGTWGAFQNQISTLGTPGGTSTTWSYNWTPPTTAGSYSIQVEAVDAANNVTPAPKPTRQFSVLAAGGGGPTLNATYNRQVSNAGGIAPIYPAGGATDPSNGDRYIADSGGSRIVKISAAGTQTEVSPLSAGWNDPRDLEFDVSDPNSLWVADTSDSQIVKMSRTGTILLTFGGPSAFTTPYGLANDATGVYVADTYGNRVQKISKTDGSVIWTSPATCFTMAFSRPRDVAVGSDGVVYVADTDNNRIVRLNASTGACLTTWGTVGSGNANLRAPRGLTSDGAGGLWIADAGNNRVKHMTNGGTFIGQAGGFGQTAGAPPTFRSAHCVFLDGTKVDVCDTFNYRIQQFSVTGAPNPGRPFWSATIGGTRPANGGFNGAFDVTYAPDGSMYAVDWFNHRIQKFNAAGVFQLEFGGYASNDGSLIFPRGVAVAPNGDVVVMDSENNRIDVFSSAGVFIQKIKPPTAQQQFLRPHQVAIAPDGTYWVADTGNNRIVHISSAGCPNNCTVLHSWTGAGQLNQPRGVAVDASGNVYVSSGANHRVLKFSTTGTLQATLATQGNGTTNVQGPYGLRIVGSGANAMLLIADAGNNRIVALTLTGTAISTFGTAGNGNGQFSSPRGMDRNPLTGEIAVADFLNNRLSIWTT